MARTPAPVVAAMVTMLTAGPVLSAHAQHVTAATAAATNTQAPGCEEGARRVTATLDALHADLERARQTHDEARMRAALDAVRAGLAEVTSRLAACRAGAVATAPQSGAMAGMDHSKMNMPAGKPLPAPPQTPAKPAVGAVDHAAMGHAAPAGAAAAPTTVRQISGPAEAALQAFQDALQIGNREVALRWLAPEATITEAGVTDVSRDAYAREHMALDMSFLKTATVVILDRQVHPAGDSAHIVTISRVSGRAGTMPVAVTVTEEAVVQHTPDGWRVASIEWSIEPAKEQKHP